MPTNVLVPVILASVALIALATWVLGWSERAKLDAGRASTRFLEEHPEARVLQVAVSQDGHSALLRLDDGLGLVTAVGSRFAVRRVSVQQVRAEPNGLRVETGDYAHPPVHLAMTPPEWALHA